MAKYNIGVVRKHFEKSLQTSHGGKVYSKQFKQLLDAKKNPFLSSKASKLTNYDRDVLQKVARGKAEHQLTDQEMSRAIKALKKIGAGSEGVELTHYGRQRSPQESYKFLQKEQAKIDAPQGPTPQELEHQRLVHERRMNVARLYRQWDIDKEQGAVAGGRFQPRSAARTTVLNRDNPRGSVTPDADHAAASVADSRQSTASASDTTDDHESPEPESPREAGEKTTAAAAPQNPDTSIPHLAGGVPGQNEVPEDDISPVTEGTMQVAMPSEGEAAPAPEPAPDSEESTSGEAPVSNQADVDNDLPLGP